MGIGRLYPIPELPILKAVFTRLFIEIGVLTKFKE
jgi:hypothetical protein